MRSTTLVPLAFGLLVLCCLNLRQSAEAHLYSEPKIVHEKSAEELVRKWELMEEGMLSSVNGLITRMVPTLLESEVEISESCSTSLFEVILGLKKLKEWTVKMLDATGKPEGGQLTGTLASFGNYDECLDVEAREEASSTGQPGDLSFTGQYCLVDLRPPLPPKPTNKILHFEDIQEEFRNFTPKTELMRLMIKSTTALYSAAFRFGACVPSSCSAEDVQMIVQSVAGKGHMNADVVSCEIKKTRPIDPSQIAVICFLVLIVLVVVISTIVDNLVTVEDKQTEGVPKRVLMAFSLPRNINRFFHVGKQDDRLTFLNGLKFMSMTWVMLGHTYLMSDTSFFRSTNTIFELASRLENQVITNGFISVDSFFFVTGLLMSYFLVCGVESKGKNIFNVPFILVKRIWRLLPAPMLLVAIIILLPHFSSGPLWNGVAETYSENCKTNWWTVLLFGSNLVPIKESCATHTWYISADMQLFIISLFYFFLLFKKTIYGHVFAAVMFFSSIISTGLTTYFYQEPPTYVFQVTDLEYLATYPNHIYYLPHVHMSVYTCGLVLGTFLAKKGEIKINRLLRLVGWCVGIALGLYAVYGVHPWNTKGQPSLALSALYSATHKTAWGLALSWLSIMCFSGNGGIANAFLSWPGFQVLNKLTYLLYLVHVPVLFYYYFSYQGVVSPPNHISFTWTFAGTLVISGVISVVVRILFEAPMTELDKIMFNMSPPKKMTPENGEGEAGRRPSQPDSATDGKRLELRPVPFVLTVNSLENGSTRKEQSKL